MREYVIMRSDRSSCLYEGECLIVAHDKELAEKYALPYNGIVVEKYEAADILERAILDRI